MSTDTPGQIADDPNFQLALDLALDYHKTVEGEYGCPGASCPGVQRLTALLLAALRRPSAEAAWLEQLRKALVEARGMMKLLDRRNPHQAVDEFLERTESLVALPAAPGSTPTQEIEK